MSEVEYAPVYGAPPTAPQGLLGGLLGGRLGGTSPLEGHLFEGGGGNPFTPGPQASTDPLAQLRALQAQALAQLQGYQPTLDEGGREIAPPVSVSWQDGVPVGVYGSQGDALDLAHQQLQDLYGARYGLSHALPFAPFQAVSPEGAMVGPTGGPGLARDRLTPLQAQVTDFLAQRGQPRALGSEQALWPELGWNRRWQGQDSPEVAAWEARAAAGPLGAGDLQQAMAAQRAGVMPGEGPRLNAVLSKAVPAMIAAVAGGMAGPAGAALGGTLAGGTGATLGAGAASGLAAGAAGTLATGQTDPAMIARHAALGAGTGALTAGAGSALRSAGAASPFLRGAASGAVGAGAKALGSVATGQPVSAGQALADIGLGAVSTGATDALAAQTGLPKTLVGAPIQAAAGGVKTALDTRQRMAALQAYRTRLQRAVDTGQLSPEQAQWLWQRAQQGGGGA